MLHPDHHAIVSIYPLKKLVCDYVHLYNIHTPMTSTLRTHHVCLCVYYRAHSLHTAYHVYKLIIILLYVYVLGMLPAFSSTAVFTREEVTRGKPAPDLFLHAAKKMGFGPQKCTLALWHIYIILLNTFY